MNFKPDNKCVDSEDITLVFEIIANSRYWQDKCNWRKLESISYTNYLCILSAILFNASYV
jgi:hypothetical protein